jgi:hypothetical protein
MSVEPDHGVQVGVGQELGVVWGGRVREGALLEFRRMGTNEGERTLIGEDP